MHTFTNSDIFTYLYIMLVTHCMTSHSADLATVLLLLEHTVAYFFKKLDVFALPFMKHKPLYSAIVISKLHSLYPCHISLMV